MYSEKIQKYKNKYLTIVNSVNYNSHMVIQVRAQGPVYWGISIGGIYDEIW